MAKTRRAYTGAAVESTLDGAINSSGVTTITVNTATGWPYGSDPYYIVISPGTASEEKVLVTRSGSGDLNLNVASDSDRGQDGTSGVAHADQATVYPVFTAVDADEANELTSMWEAKGDIISHGTSTFSRLAVGTNDYVLQADSSAASGLAWGQVATAGIADSAVTAAKIADDAVAAAKIADDAVVTAGILDANVTEAKLATAVVNKLVPAGTISATIRSTADTGYLLLDGSTVASAQTTYPALWAVVPVSWQSGSSLVLPDMSDKMLFGQSTTSLGASGGANSKTIAQANLPTHQHTIGHGHAHTITADQASHTHTISVTVNDNATDLVTRGDAYNTTYQYVVPYDSNQHGSPYTTNPSPHDGYGMGLTFASGTVPGMAAGNITSHGHTASGSATSTDPAITVSGSVTNHTGSSGDGGFANSALDVTNAHLAVNFQIKAH